MSYFAHNGNYPFGIDLSRYNATADLKRWPDLTWWQSTCPKLSLWQFARASAGGLSRPDV